MEFMVPRTVLLWSNPKDDSPKRDEEQVCPRSQTFQGEYMQLINQHFYSFFDLQKCQHEFRRKTILSKSPMVDRSKTRSSPHNQSSASTKHHPHHHHHQHLVTKCHSLPRKYKQTAFNRRPKVQSSTLEPQEFKRRLETIRSWASEFSDSQLTALISTVFPLLGAPQLHFLSSQLPEHNPGMIL